MDCGRGGCRGLDCHRSFAWWCWPFGTVRVGRDAHVCDFINAYHQVLVMTGVAPLVLLALIAMVSALFVLGGHVMRRTAGPLPVKRALLAGLPAELLVCLLRHGTSRDAAGNQREDGVTGGFHKKLVDEDTPQSGARAP